MLANDTIAQQLGMVGASAVIVSILFLGIVDRKLVNRLSIRLIFALAIADLLNHVATYLGATQAVNMWSGACYFLAGFQMFTRTFYNFTNIAICFNLFRALILMKKSTWAYELAVWVTMLIATVPLMVGYYFLDAFTGTSSKAGCNPGTRDLANNRIFSILAGFFCLITILSGILVTIFGHMNMNRWIEVYLNNGAYNEEDKEELKKKLRRMAQLSFLYPLSTCITLPCEMAFNFKMATGVRDRNLISGMAVTGGISGLLTLIAFSIDPIVWRTFKSAFNIIKQKRSGVTETKDNNSIELMDL